MPGRKFSAGSVYRYGFNGKENDKDAGEGIQDYGMRIYDGRLGRFLSIDPLASKFGMLTPYQYASNTPIAAIDIDGKEAEVVIDKAKQTAIVNFKFTYDDAIATTMKAASITMDDLKKGFEFYFVPAANGNTQAVNGIMDRSGLNQAQLEKLLGGKIASGNGGYFNVDVGNNETYKVFFTLTIDNKLTAKDPTVFALDESKTGQNEQNGKGVHLSFPKGGDKTTIIRKFGHELGHQGGLPDYGGSVESDHSENPFLSPNVKMTNQYGVQMDYGIGELMDKKNTTDNRILSEVSIYRMINKAIEVAKTQTENTVTVLSGGAESEYSPHEQDHVRTTYKPVQKIISKDD